MQYAFIGTGNMGTILIESLIESGAIHPSQIIASNRTPEKLERLANKFTELKVSHNKNAAREASILFLCVKPHDYPVVLDEISESLTPGKIVLSITSSIGPAMLERHSHAKAARIIPSITNSACSGASLITFGSRIDASDKQILLRLFSTISKPIEINEDITRISSDLVSCGPAFFSFLVQRYIDCAVKETNISKDQATSMITEMLIGLGKLLEEGRYTLPALQEKVCVPGGVTGIGLEVLDKTTDQTFERLIEATHQKFKTDIEEVTHAFAKSNL
ncbi:late competence protein ComER [Aneurinibacillus sp. Ricciae_BoGa-3]|uniref:late competence protein ComER n=1 Tax=Aneurinibacillus sp. Ricciae_BoGa-3 TaxID=3022697 RepID=UPI00233FD147|nr:late competence protein ComER [Aneurinibacillus sp. Ricciae_BoGa-3]WCK53512.1 late competence protein ComER [Aneurinibacillus sp. Ricciae_BoGa-3]